jgi:hypothetical protein
LPISYSVSDDTAHSKGLNGISLISMGYNADLLDIYISCLVALTSCIHSSLVICIIFRSSSARL